MRGIHQIVTGLTYGDAITHHSCAVQDIVRSWGFSSHLFAEHRGPEFLSDCYDLRSFQSMVSSDDPVIFHYSIHSHASDLVRTISNPLILVYHNITPSHFFSSYNQRYAALLEKGRLELQKFQSRTVFALADSEYNRQELEEIGFSKTAVFPIIFNNQMYRVPANRVLLEMFDDEYVNLLCVGRIVPQKKLEDAIRMFALYRRAINNKARLIFIGEHRGFESYFYALLRLVDRLELGEVYFTGLIPFNELISFYRIADVLLSASLHEGFCVPLLEAMYFRVPIVARSCGAIPSTLDSAGILYDSASPLLLAELVDYIIHHKEIRRKLAERGQTVLKKHSDVSSKEVLHSLLADFLEV